MKLIKIFAYLCLLFGFTSCTHSVHMVSFSEFKPYASQQKGKPIEAKAEQFVVFWFADNTHYVNQAYNQLSRQCPDGTVTGISTQYYTSHGFFSWTNHVVMQGLCIN